MPRSSAVLLVLLPLTGACDEPAAPAPAPAWREGWTDADDPRLLRPDFEYRLARLPTAGEAAQTPWAGSYWPAYRDSINDRWAGPNTPSPAEKYGLAFGVAGVEDAVSAYTGVDGLAGEPCSSDAQCDPDRGSLCARRRGAAEGVCSETWLGICHGWAPASILEGEPRVPVTHGGITFGINDLKALVSLAYTSDLAVRYLSLRCNDAGLDADTAGSACRDTNPGSFHVVVANLLGLRGQAFIEDRTYDVQVWNQPVRSFKVTHNAPISGAQANQLLGAGPVLRSLRRSGSVDSGVWRTVGSVAVSPGQTLRARMAGTGDADLYLRWDAAPSVTRFDCRPYVETTDELCELVAPPGATTAEVAVLGYAERSSYELAISVLGPPPAAYAFNPDAVSLRQIRTELRWIGEAPTDQGGPLADVIDEYTFTDVYDYVLELDAAGRILGGEWLGGSKIAHPDFLWVPVRKQRGEVAGVIAWDDVKLLLDLSRP